MTDPELIVNAVKSDSVLAGLLSGAIYPVVLPKDPPLPAVTYALASQPTEWTQEQAQYRWPRWRFRIYSLMYADLIPIAIGLASLFGDRTRSPATSDSLAMPSSLTLTRVARAAGQAISGSGGAENGRART